MSRDIQQEGMRLATKICTIIDANIGLAALNAGPESTYIVAVWKDIIRERTIRFRGHDPDSQRWVASAALGLVRRICLGIPDTV